ncbi:MAG TPA: aminodeoxychorismate/anthranilate synthase component II [Flavobacteriales bacterium]|nr:aminodeoxychorismate/anthranilate synthase component II [Flavobacteriales bacterium]
MKVLLLDNYDSFTFNIAHILSSMPLDLRVHRNDEILVDQVSEFDRIIFSPGPGLPGEAGIMREVLEKYADKIPIMGICLGFQAIVERFGGKLHNLGVVKHGTAEKIDIVQHDLFSGINRPMEVGLYHSWAVRASEVGTYLDVLATSGNLVMAAIHRELNIFGVQFHPESVMTPNGKELIMNWLNYKHK